MHRLASVGIAATVGLVPLLVAVPVAWASCAGSGPEPPREAVAGQVLPLAGSFLLECRDTGGAPFPKATAPPRFRVTVSELPGYRHERVIGHVSLVRVQRPRSGTPSAKFQGSAQVPNDLPAGRYSLEVYGSWGFTLTVLHPDPTHEQLPATGAPATTLLLLSGVALASGIVVLVASRRFRRARSARGA